MCKTPLDIVEETKRGGLLWKVVDNSDVQNIESTWSNKQQIADESNIATCAPKSIFHIDRKPVSIRFWHIFIVAKFAWAVLYI